MTDRSNLVGPFPDGVDRDAYDRLRRRVLWSLPTGLHVLGSHGDGRRNLMTISWVTQGSMNPKTVVVGVESTSVSHGLVSAGGVFALSLLDRGQRALVRHFVKPVEDVQLDALSRRGTMNGEPVVLAPSGAPVLAAAAAWLDCAVVGRLDLGSHTVFAGEVTGCGAGNPLEPAEGEDVPHFEPLRMEDTRMSYGG